MSPEKGDFIDRVKLMADLVNRIGFPILTSVFLGWLVLFKMEEQKTIVVKTMNDVALALNLIADRLGTRPR